MSTTAPLRQLLDLLPYQQWLPAAEVAARTGLAPQDTPTVLRFARRKGSVLVKGTGEDQRVMRVRRLA
jgi:hypothetical protein